VPSGIGPAKGFELITFVSGMRHTVFLSTNKVCTTSQQDLDWYLLLPAALASSSARRTASSSQQQVPVSLTGASHIPRYPQLKITERREFLEENFLPPTHTDFTPETPKLWQQGLSRVQRSWKRIYDHSNLEALRGYPVLDPHQILRMGTRDEGRCKTYLVCWMVMRLPWLYRTTNRTSTPLSTTLAASSSSHPQSTSSSVQKAPNRFPRSQEWRDYLASVAGRLGLLESVNHAGGSNKRRKTTGNDLNTLFGIEWPDDVGAIDVTWQGSVVITEADLDTRQFNIPSSTIREIVWDLSEHNFRLEFLALNRCIWPRQQMSTSAAERREEMIRCCFPQQSLILLNLPRYDLGLGAQGFEDRYEYVEAFQEVLATWPGSGAEALRGMTAVRREGKRVSEAHGEEVYAIERVAYRFYCQTFFDYFGRAPTIPCLLPTT